MQENQKNSNCAHGCRGHTIVAENLKKKNFSQTIERRAKWREHVRAITFFEQAGVDEEYQKAADRRSG